VIGVEKLGPVPVPRTVPVFDCQRISTVAPAGKPLAFAVTVLPEGPLDGLRVR
jgi:hypothetical protein